MSLFSSVESSISAKASSAGGQLSGLLGGGKAASAVGSAISNIGSSAAMGLINKYVPGQVKNALNTGASMLGDIQAGNYDGAALSFINAGYLDKLIAGSSGAAAQARFWGTPTPLMGGVSPKEALQIHEALRNLGVAKKNHWMLEVSSWAQGDVSSTFNMLAVETDFAPMTITADKKKIGAATLDLVQSSEPVELRITTMDTQDGFIKRWFDKQYAIIAPIDGTVGVPADYAIKIKVVHSFITRGSDHGGYAVLGLYRPGNLEISLSRREDNLQEVQLTFSQLDTFMAA